MRRTLTAAAAAAFLIVSQTATPRAMAQQVRLRGELAMATVRWSPRGPHSLATMERRILRVMSSGAARTSDRRAAVTSVRAAPLTISHPLGIAEHPSVTARRRPRLWWHLSPSWHIVNPSLPGARFEGMVFGYLSSGQFYRCTGTVVNTPNGSVVLTAGHCIDNKALGQPFAQMAFVPYAQQGTDVEHPAAPLGVWPVARWVVARSWYTQGTPTRMRRDLGALLVDRNPSGQTLEQVVGGAQGVSFRGVDRGRAEAMGYPAAPPFTGNDRLFACGPRRIGLIRYGGAGPEPIGMSCGLSLGASGGPWLVHVHRGIGTIISLTSVNNNGRGHPQLLAGPVLDGVARGLVASLARAAPPTS